MVMYPNSAALKKDDDLCVHLLLDSFGMDPGEKLGAHHATDFKPPTQDQKEVMHIVRELVINRRKTDLALKELLRLDAVRRLTDRKDTAALTRFKEHATRYLRLYEDGNPIEIGRTSRYSHVTGKSELGVFATFAMNQKGVRLTDHISGDLAPFLETDSGRDSDLHHAGESSAMGAQLEVAKRDFSVIFSSRYNRELFFLGTARFVNHDCDPNCEFLPGDKDTVSFKTKRPIRLGEELTCYYKDDYFGEDNCDCLCATCERRGEGWYARNPRASVAPSESDASERSMATSSKVRRPLGSTSANSPIDNDSQPNTPEPIDSPDENRHDRRVRLARNQVFVEDFTAIRILRGKPERRERYCRVCKGGIELVLKGGSWVDKDRNCARCTRHSRIFLRKWPDKPAIEPRPDYQPYGQHAVSSLARLDSRAERERALRKQCKQDPVAFERNHPGQRKKWREEKHAKKGRSYQMEEFELERVRTYGSVPSTYIPFKQKISGLSWYLRATIENVALVRHRDCPMIRVDNVIELLKVYKNYDVVLSNSLPRIELVDCDAEVFGTWVHVDSISTLAQYYKVEWLLARFLAHPVDLRWPVPNPVPVLAAPSAPVYPKRAAVKPPASIDKGKGRERTASDAPRTELADPDLPDYACEINEGPIEGLDAYRTSHPVPHGARKAKGDLPAARQAPPILAGPPAHVRKVIYKDTVTLYEVEIRDGLKTHVIGRMARYSWIHLSALLDLVKLTEEDKNFVYSKISNRRDKQIYSVPAGTEPLPNWHGVWCPLAIAKRMAHHFGVLGHLENLLQPTGEFNEYVASLADSDGQSAPGSASPHKSPRRSSLSDRSPVRPSSQKRASLSPRRPGPIRDLSDDDAAYDEADSPSELVAQERKLEREIWGSPSEPGEAVEDEDVKRANVIMASQEDVDAIEDGSDLELASRTPDAAVRDEPLVPPPQRVEITQADLSSDSSSDDDVVFDREVIALGGAVAPKPVLVVSDSGSDDDEQTPNGKEKRTTFFRKPSPKRNPLWEPAPTVPVASTSSSAATQQLAHLNLRTQPYATFSPGSSVASTSSPRLISSERDIPPRPRSRSSTRTLSSDGPLGARGTPLFASALASASSSSASTVVPRPAAGVKRPHPSSRSTQDVIPISSSDEDKPPKKQQFVELSDSDSDCPVIPPKTEIKKTKAPEPSPAVKREQSRVPWLGAGNAVASGSGTSNGASSRGGLNPPPARPRLTVTKREIRDDHGKIFKRYDEIELSD